MKIYLDDERVAPEGWTQVKTPQEAIELLKSNRVTHLSVDHDLGLSDESTGYTVLLWIEEQVVMSGYEPPSITVHSANAGARTKMELAVTSINEKSTSQAIKDERALLQAMKARHGELLQLLTQFSSNPVPADADPEQLMTSILEAPGHWEYEDRIYRFYHQSLKVFSLQSGTLEIVEMLKSLLPHRELNSRFVRIIRGGTGKKFSADMNKNWLRHTRPILEAFFHARFMLEMAVKYSILPAPPSGLPSGYAALLYLYNLR